MNHTTIVVINGYKFNKYNMILLLKRITRKNISKRFFWVILNENRNLTTHHWNLQEIIYNFPFKMMIPLKIEKESKYLDDFFL